MSVEIHQSSSRPVPTASESSFEKNDSYQLSGGYHDVEALSDTNDDYSLQEPLHTPPRRISAWVMIPLWIGLSSSVILLNKQIFSVMRFPYPVFLTGFHMLLATIGSQILRRTTSLLNQLDSQPITMQAYTRSILPLGVLFSASLVLSNTAYVYLSVPFVQMLKAFIPVLVHVMSWSIRLVSMDRTIFLILTVISFGCVIAALGELTFSNFGFVCQVLAVIVESARLVSVQVLIGKQKLSPLPLVYLYAPLCFVLIAILQPILEGPEVFAHIQDVGLSTLLLSGGLAFALNIAGVYLIHSAGSLVLTLSGVLKDIVLIVLAVMVGSVVSSTQVIGYGIALFGLVAFKQRGSAPVTPDVDASPTKPRSSSRLMSALR